MLQSSENQNGSLPDQKPRLHTAQAHLHPPDLGVRYLHVMPSEAVFQHDDILQAHQEPGFLLLRSVLMDFSSPLVCWQVGQEALFYEFWLDFNLRLLPQALCGFWLTSRITSTGIRYDHRLKMT